MRILLPTQTRFVTPGSTELHFYSDRHVRDRVRLHLRRVTENNNRERRTRRTTTEKISSIGGTRAEADAAGKSRSLPKGGGNRWGGRRRLPRPTVLNSSEHAQGCVTFQGDWTLFVLCIGCFFYALRSQLILELWCNSNNYTYLQNVSLFYFQTLNNSSTNHINSSSTSVSAAPSSSSWVLK